MRNYKYTPMNLEAAATGNDVEVDALLTQMQSEDDKFEAGCKAAAAEFVAQFPGTPERAIWSAYRKGGFGVQFSSDEKENAFFAIQKKHGI